MDKRYQVFISSTYSDLREERRLVTETLMKMDFIPAGMELFPASDEEQFDFIKRVINDCDYYLLIIGGRYGSVTSEGVSYTEKEFDYALEKGVRVIALLHENPGAISLDRSEPAPEAREKLEAFKTRVKTGRLVTFWNEAKDLPGQVALSMMSARKLFPQVGWVRADKAASEDLLQELNNVRKENERLRAELEEKSMLTIKDLAPLEDEIEVSGYRRFLGGYDSFHGAELYETEEWHVKSTWQSMFSVISPAIMGSTSDGTVGQRIADACRKSDDQNLYTTHPNTIKMLKVQFQAYGLIELTESGLWKLSDKGRKLMIRLRAVKRRPTPDRA